MQMQEVIRPEEVMRSGHAACPGCGVAMGMRMVLRALGKRAVVVVVPSCVAVVSGPYPYAALDVPILLLRAFPLLNSPDICSNQQSCYSTIVPGARRLGSSAAPSSPARARRRRIPRNVRVAANSPSLCPTMFSVTYTGMCLRPS